MNDLRFFYSAKMAVVFILMLLLSTTLEAQRNENDKFFDLMAAIGAHFGGEFNDAEKALELDLNGANLFLEGLHKFATREIVRKNEKNGEFACKESKQPFIEAIKAILGENTQNFIKAHIVPKQSNAVLDTVYTIKTISDERAFKKVEDLIKELSVKFSEEQLLKLLFSFAARLEALVHGKNSDGTLKEKQENSKDKIQIFLAVPKCFILPEVEELSIFDYWIEIIEMKTEESQKLIFGVAIYKEKYNAEKSEESKEKAFELSRENYKILEQLNDQKFSIYESSNLLREIFNKGSNIPRGKIPQIFKNLLNQIESVFSFEWETEFYVECKCAYAMLFQNISENLMKMISDKGIDPKLPLDSVDFKIRKDVQKDFEENCKKFENEKEKIMFLNNMHYELAINFEFNQRKDVYDRVDDLLIDWVAHSMYYRVFWISNLLKELTLTNDAWRMLSKIENLISNRNRERISIIEALIGKKHINQFNLGLLFDQMKWLVHKAIPKEEGRLWEAKKEINTKQLENEIKFLKNNPKSIGDEKYQKAVAIICTIKQHGEKVEMLTSKKKVYENAKDQDRLNDSSLKIQQYREDFGPELWEKTKESCNQLKLNQIEIKETVSEEILDDLYEIWKSFDGGWRGIEEYYLKIPLKQLKEQALTLAKTFEKMLQNVKEHYAPKMDESNDGGDMIISE